MDFIYMLPSNLGQIELQSNTEISRYPRFNSLANAQPALWPPINIDEQSLVPFYIAMAARGLTSVGSWSEEGVDAGCHLRS